MGTPTILSGMVTAPHHRIFSICAAFLLSPVWAMAQIPGSNFRPQPLAADAQLTAGRGPRQPPPSFTPSHPADVILGRPTSSSIVLSVLSDCDTEAMITYGTQSKDLPAQTEIRSFKKDQPQEIILEKLRPDSRYFWQLRDAVTEKPLVKGTFRTQRAPGNAFTFTITADSHLDENTDPVLYQRTMANALADGPDFHIDLGDTFMTEKHENRVNAARQYLAQRFYFGQL